MGIHRFRAPAQENSVYMFKVPECSLFEVGSVMIACCEKGAIPPVKELKHFQPLAMVLIPGAQLLAPPAEMRSTADIMHPPPHCHSFKFLESVTVSMPNVQQMIICTHSGCKFTREEESMSERLSELATALAVSDLLKTRRIKLHAWHFEPEINWVSFYDTDTGLMLPLNADSYPNEQHASL